MSAQSFSLQLNATAFRAALPEFRATAMLPAWWTLALSVSMLLIGLALTPIQFAMWPELRAVAPSLLFLAFMAVLFTGSGQPAIGAALEAVAVFGGLAFAVPMLTYVLASSNLPMQDAALHRIDAIFGIDWIEVVDWFKRHPAISIALSISYETIAWQPLPLILALALVDRPRLRILIGAWAATLMVCVLCQPLVPAVGGYLHLGYAAADYPDVRVFAPFTGGAILEQARDGTMTLLDRRALEGIVTFPSFHAICALLFAWGWLAVPVLRWPGVALNAMMLVSTVPIGAHYHVDVVVGSLIAWLGLVLVECWQPGPAPATTVSRWRDVPEVAALAGRLGQRHLSDAPPAHP